MAVSLKVNGTVHSVTADLDTPLLYVLRNDLSSTPPNSAAGLVSAAPAQSSSTALRHALASRRSVRLRNPRSPRSKVSGRLSGPTRCSLLSWRNRRRSAATASPASS